MKVLLKWLKDNPNTVALLFVLCIWYIVSETRIIGATLLASPREVLTIIGNAFRTNASISEKFYIHAYYTIIRALEGWLIGIGLGVFGGVLIGSTRLLHRASEPLVEFLRAIPPILAFPLFLVAYNYGEPAYIWTIVFGCLPMMILTVARGAQSITSDTIDVITAFNIKRSISYFIRAMEIIPSVFLGARLIFSTALIITVVTEMVFSPRNGYALGALARDSEIDFNTPMFYACVLSIGLFGYISNILLKKIEMRFGCEGN